MAHVPVNFTYHSGLNRGLFRNVRLVGSWDSSGRFSDQWSESPMTPALDETGCPCFTATVLLDDSQVGLQFHWGAMADTPKTPNRWAIVDEVPDANSGLRHRSFTLAAGGQSEHYWFAVGRRFGAAKYFPAGQTDPAIRFSLWAPNAQKVDVVFGGPSGYIADDGTGADPTTGPFPLAKRNGGIWETDVATSPALASFEDFHERPYMYRVVNEQGHVTYKTDIYSRNQMGRGRTNPGGKPYSGSPADLNGIVSCSMVADPDRVTADFDDTGHVKETLITAEEFWRDEFRFGLTPSQRIEDLVIYELHVGSLGFGSTDAGTFADAVAFVDALVDLGVNAVELLPVLEFDGDRQWGYGTSHFFCLQSSAGGGNRVKHFVRACHRKGIAVILDVCYNHFATNNCDRAEWGYDSDPGSSPEHNIYLWYEGKHTDYTFNEGGYVDNGSSGFAPRYSEECVRKMFTSSAAALLDDFHIDGIRVDLTGAIHQDNALHADGRSVGSANLYGIKLLRELTRTLKMINPHSFLIAEDHTGWSAMTQSPDQGGIGFDALWYADFYHHLSGDGNYGDNYARLLKQAGAGDERPLRMDYFAGALSSTQFGKVAYHESHDEAGNGENTERTMLTAVQRAPLFGDTRTYAEARARCAFGLAVTSAGTPMFLMGEEIGASKFFRYDDFFKQKEDLIGERTGNGRALFRFYQDLTRLVTKSPALRSREIDVLHTNNDGRVIVFRRKSGGSEMLIAASLNNRPFDRGYVVQTDPSRLPSGGWQEVFNSDAASYGGANVGNFGATIPSSGGRIEMNIPANGFIVLHRV